MARRVDRTGKLDQHAVAGRLNYPSAMRGDGRIEKRYSGCLEPGQRTFLISTHQTTVLGDICRQYRR